METLAALAAELGAPELCTPDAGQSAERSCAAREAAEVLALRAALMAARSPKLLEALRKLEFAPLALVLPEGTKPDVSAAR